MDSFVEDAFSIARELNVLRIGAFPTSVELSLVEIFRKF